MDTNLDPEKLNTVDTEAQVNNFETAPGVYPKPKEFNPIEFGDESLDVKLEPLEESGDGEEKENVVIEEVKEEAGNTDALQGLEYTTQAGITKDNLLTDAIHENTDLTKPGEAWKTVEALENLIGGDTVEKI